MRKFALGALALGMLAAGASSTAQAGSSILNNWNVIVTGNAYVRTETEGPVRVGGDLYVDGTFNINPRSGTLDGTGGVGLMVGGNITGAQFKGLHLLGGSTALVGGASTSTSIFDPSNKATVGDATVAPTVAGDAALLAGYSNGFAALAANNAFQFVNGNTGLFKVTSVDANGNAVFDVTATQVFGNSSIGQLILDLNNHTFGDGQSVIINVSGNVSRGNNFIGAFNANVANVLWNFTDATTIDLDNRNFAGTMLAHNATLLNTQTIEGSVFVKAIGDSSNPFNGQKAEIHPPLYRGYIPESPPPSVPEPASLAMAAIAALTGGAIVGLRRRRSQPTL